MPPTKDYMPPTPEMCAFLIFSLSQLSGSEQMESQDLAKRLYDAHEGPKQGLSHNSILDTFPWLAQIGVIDYKSRWAAKGGNRLYLWRKAEPSQLRSLISPRKTIPAGDATAKEKPVAKVPEPVVQASKPKPKKRKKCCDDPKIVKSKKTGKRRCKNCGTKLKAKKGET